MLMGWQNRWDRASTKHHDAMCREPLKKKDRGRMYKKRRHDVSDPATKGKRTKTIECLRQQLGNVNEAAEIPLWEGEGLRRCEKKRWKKGNL